MKQRPIKFRAWDKQAKKWVSRQYTEVNGLGDVYFNDYPTKRTFCEDRLDIEISQYTGLKDKNGKEIYEGDIIEHWGDRYIVPNFVPLSRLYEAESILPHHDGSDDWMAMSDCDWEVIGNRYENPELIKKK